MASIAHGMDVGRFVADEDDRQRRRAATSGPRHQNPVGGMVTLITTDADEEFEEYLDVRAERRENQLLPDFSVERISYG